MKLTLISTAAFLLSVGHAAAQDAGPPSAIATQLRALGPVIDVPAMQKIYKPLLAGQPTDGVTRTNDHAYGTHARNRLDVYAPTGSGGSAPVVIYFHGGGFIRGDKADRDNTGYFLARHGIVAAVATYRLAPAATWPAGAEDVVAAFQWVKANAANHGGDPRRIFIMGESAGASHVAAATLRKRFHPPGGLDAAGVILISGAGYNVEMESRSRRQFRIATPDPRNDAYFGTDAARFREMSTAANVDAPPVPVLITYAELDPIQMQVQAGELYARLCTAHGACPEIKVVAGHNHISQVYTFNTGDTSLSRFVLEAVRGK